MNSPDIARGMFEKQERARTGAASAKAKVATLERDRHVALLSDSDIEAVLAIDDQIAHQRRVMAACEARAAVLSRPLSPDELSALGLNRKYHPITGLALEDGAGAWAPERQARELHLPIIAKRDGEAVATAMLAKLDAAAKAA